MIVEAARRLVVCDPLVDIVTTQAGQLTLRELEYERVRSLQVVLEMRAIAVVDAG